MDSTVKLKRRLRVLLFGTALGASFLSIVPARADEEQLQRQITAMQHQLEAMKRELAQTKKQQAVQQQAAPQQASAAQAHAHGGVVIPNTPQGGGSWMPTKAMPAWFDSVHISMAGSFLAMEGAYRQHSEVSNGASDPPFGSIPLQNSALWNEREFRASAQQSRIALGITGDIDPNQHLKGYYEMDFLGAATDSNNRESNSFNPRIRQLFGEYDNDNYHFHFVAGQAWSLLTQDRVGMLPQSENVPLTIDAQYVVGFNWARLPQIRFVEDFNKVAWFGVSFEAPGAIVPGTSGTPPVGTPSVVNGNLVSTANTCNAGSHLDGLAYCSNDIMPDIVEKVAVDPGFGHYEVLGLQRWFTDQVSPNTTIANWSQKTTFGWGVGGNALLPVIPKVLDLQGSILYGQGIGRYGSSQLQDVVVGADGTLSPVTALHFLTGAVAHPFAGNDIYAYYGREQTYANAWTVGTAQGGWGNPNFANNGCLNQSDTAGGAGFNTPITGTTCTFNVKTAEEFSIGFWQDAYKGDVGRVRYGLQYEFVKLTAFPGLATGTGTPNQGLTPYNNIGMFSIRYYPFN